MRGRPQPSPQAVLPHRPRFPSAVARLGRVAASVLFRACSATQCSVAASPDPQKGTPKQQPGFVMLFGLTAGRNGFQRPFSFIFFLPLTGPVEAKGKKNIHFSNTMRRSLNNTERSTLKAIREKGYKPEIKELSGRAGSVHYYAYCAELRCMISLSSPGSLDDIPDISSKSKAQASLF